MSETTSREDFTKREREIVREIHDRFTELNSASHRGARMRIRSAQMLDLRRVVEESLEPAVGIQRRRSRTP